MTNEAMPISLLEWRPIKRNSLRGFATIRIGKSLKVKDVAVYSSNGKRWASLPSKPMIGKDGAVAKDSDGKARYVQIMEWIDRETSERFSEGVIQAIEREHPGETAAD